MPISAENTEMWPYSSVSKCNFPLDFKVPSHQCKTTQEDELRTCPSLILPCQSHGQTTALTQPTLGAHQKGNST